MNDFKKEIQFEPAYDKRHGDPNKNYGIHGLIMRFLLHGPKGTTQFVVYTNWQLPHVQEEQLEKSVYDRVGLRTRFLPMGVDVGYHAKVQQHEYSSKMDCDLLEQGYCYYDGSGLAAENLLQKLIEEGDEEVWETLREWHDDLKMEEVSV